MDPSIAGDGDPTAGAGAAEPSYSLTSSAGASTSAAASAYSSSPVASHYLAKCVLRGSAVLHSAQGRFRSPSAVDVVFGKETSLELVVVGDDGVVQSICEQTVFGIIKDLAVLQWSNRYFGSVSQLEGKDVLVVLSDSGKLSFLSFCSEMHRFFAVANIVLSKPGNLRHQLGRMLAVDPEGRFVAVSAYENKFAILSVSLNSEGTIIDEKFFYPPENEEDTSSIRGASTTSICGTVWSMCFISGGPNDLSLAHYYPVLAMIIHRKGSDVNDLSLFGCDPRTGLVDLISSYSETGGPLALDVTAIPQFSGFALLLRVGDALLMDLRNPKNICYIHKISLTTTLIEERIIVDDSCRGLDVDDDVAASALLELRDSGDDVMKDDSYMNIDSADNRGNVKSRIVCSWSWDPATQTCAKLLFCLDDGEFYILEISLDIEGVRVDLSGCIYRGLPCRPLLWLKCGMVAGLVEMGDGMIFKLEHGRLIHKSSIQNVAPILDLVVADYYGEKQDQMFACCGMSPKGSLRIIRNGVNVEKLLRTEPIYQGVTGIWTVRMKITDVYHSFLVLSFVEETRILSVGLSFNDVSDAVGFQPDVCTLACGLVADGLLVQIHSKGIRLCFPTTYAHPEGAPLTVPPCTGWYPNVNISVGAVGHNFVVVATSNPCCLFILGVRSISSFQYELYVTQRVQLHYEVSCMSIPQEPCSPDSLASDCAMDDFVNNHPAKVDVGKFVVIGTHKPSVEILSLEPGEAFSVLAIGPISVNNALGSPISGCIPESVRFVSAERFYILTGLRNGMLLRFEWLEDSSKSDPIREHYFPGFCYEDSSSSSAKASPSFVNTVQNTGKVIPPILRLIAIRRIGITPVVLIPLHDSPNADIIVLSDRPWLLHTARHSLAYSSISFLPASHVTPVCSLDCPNGLLFVAENCLHLVEMDYGKRLNAQKFSLGGTPRKVLYHGESRTLLVLRTGLNGASCSSDIVRLDPLNGMLLSRFKCERGETAKCMQIAKLGSEQVLIVGTSKSAGRPIMPSGEAESTKGRIVVLSLELIESPRESCSAMQASSFNSSFHIGSPFREIVGYASEELSSSSMCSSPDDIYCDKIQLEQMAGQLRSLAQIGFAGAVLAVCPYLDRYVLASAGNMLCVLGFVNENPHRLKKYATGRTRFTITSIKTHATRIAVGDCRDGVLFYSYHENLRKLELVYSDPAQRLVGDIALLDCETAVVSDRRGSISVLTCPSFEVSESPEKNLAIHCSFYMGETAMSIQKAAFKYRLPIDDDTEPLLEPDYECVVASTLLGSVFVMIPLTSEERQLLQAVQERLSVHPLTAPVLGNDHTEFRRRGVPLGVPPILDGDMLVQFLELTNSQQEAVLASPGKSLRSSISVSQVVCTLEQVHYALN